VDARIDLNAFGETVYNGCLKKWVDYLNQKSAAGY